MELGQVVYSIAGRDSKRHFVVVEIVSDTEVKIADGDLRRIRSAKLKKTKHLHSTGDVLEKIANKLKSEAQIFDAELYSALRFYSEN